MPRDPSGNYSTPVGTDGVPNFPIESSKYNVFVHDVETDLNAARPILSGGTGSINADEALFNLRGEKAGFVITNYDLDLFQSGSFYSAAGATNAPVTGHAFTGFCYASDPPAYPPTNNNLVIEARDESETLVIGSGIPGKIYVREKKLGVWGEWSSDTQSILDLANTKVAKAGDTMTGALVINYPSAQYSVTDSNTGGNSMIMGWGAGTGDPNKYGFYALPFGTIANMDATTGDFFVNGNTTGGGYIATNTYFQVAGGTVVSSNNIEIGYPASAGYVYMDFHSSGTSSDYDVRFASIGGTSTSGQGQLVAYAAESVFSGTIRVDGSGITANPVYLNTTNYTITDGSNYIIRTPNAIYMENNSGGIWGYFNSGGLIMSVGGISTPGTLTSANINSGNITASGNCYSNYFGHVTNNYYDAGGYYRAIFGQANPAYATMYVEAVHYPGAFAAIRLNPSSGGDFQFRPDGTAWKNGGGLSWAALSDARTKTVVSDYPSGLDAIAALRPVRYTYKGNSSYVGPEHDQPKINANNDTVYVGLLAQEAEVTMPELFITEKGYIDGVAVSDMRSADYSALTFALVNAIKELKARVEQLEAAP